MSTIHLSSSSSSSSFVRALRKRRTRLVSIGRSRPSSALSSSSSLVVVGSCPDHWNHPRPTRRWNSSSSSSSSSPSSVCSSRNHTSHRPANGTTKEEHMLAAAATVTAPIIATTTTTTTTMNRFLDIPVGHMTPLELNEVRSTLLTILNTMGGQHHHHPDNDDHHHTTATTVSHHWEPIPALLVTEEDPHNDGGPPMMMQAHNKRIPSWNVTDQADQLLRRWLDEATLLEGNESASMPDAPTIHMVLDAWRLITTTNTNTFHPYSPENDLDDERTLADTAAKRAHDLLQFIMDRNHTNNVTHNDYSDYDERTKQQQPIRSSSRRRIPLDIKAYTLVIDALSKCGEAEEAEAILTQMVESGMTPDAICWNATIHAWSRWPRKQQQQQRQQTHHVNHVQPGLQAAQRAQELLDLMLLSASSSTSFDHNDDGTIVRPTVATFNAVIDCYSKSGIPNAGYLAEDVVRRMKEWSKQQQQIMTNDPSSVTTRLEPNTITLTSLMDCWSRSTGEYGEAAAERAEAILQHMVSQQQQQQGQQHAKKQSMIPPTTMSFAAGIRAWAHCGTDRGAHRAQRLLEMMERLYQGGNPHVAPNAVCFNTVISAMAHNATSSSSSFQSAERADAILQQMGELYQSGRNELKPNTVSYSSVIQAYARSTGNTSHRNSSGGGGGSGPRRRHGQIKPSDSSAIAARRAEKLLHRMQFLHDSGDPNVVPTTVTYNAVLSAIAKSGETSAVSRAEALLQRMLDLYKAGNNNHLKPDHVSFGAVIHSWAQHARHESIAPQHAEALLERMKQLGSTPGMKHLKPDTICYSSVISAWSKSRDPRAAERAESILNQMQAAYETGDNPEAQPNTVAFTAVMRAHSKSRTPNAAERSLALLHRMEHMYHHDGNDAVKPDTIAYNTALHALSQSREPGSAEKAEELLMRMVQQHDENSERNTMPDTVSFNSVIGAFAKRGDSQAPQRVEALLNLMIDLNESGKNPNVKPDVITFSSIINAWSKSGHRNAAEQAETLLRKMEQTAGVRPDNPVYNSVIHVYAKSRNAHRAEQLLYQMEHPDIISFNTTISAWATSGLLCSADKAIQILQRMQEDHSNGKCVKPTTVIYNACLNAIVKGPDPKKSKKAQELITDMERRSLEDEDTAAQPDIRSYNFVILACAHSAVLLRGNRNRKAREEAMAIALNTFRKVRDSRTLKPDQFTYSSILHSIAYLALDDGKATNNQAIMTLVWATFQECCESGYLTDESLHYARRILPNSYWIEKLNGKTEHGDPRTQRVKSLNSHWSRNAQQGYGNRRQKK